MTTQTYPTKVRNVISPAARVSVMPCAGGGFEIHRDGRAVARATQRRDADLVALGLRAIDNLQAMMVRVALLQQTLSIVLDNREQTALRRAFGRLGE